MRQISGAVIAIDDDLILPEISDSDAARLAKEIDLAGFAVISSYIDDTLLAKLRAMVISMVNNNAGEYVALTGTAEIAGTLLERIGAAPGFLNLMHSVYEKGQGRVPPSQS